MAVVVRRRRCPHCDELFLPDPRVRDRQRVCSAEACQRARRRQAVRRWLEAHPDYVAAEPRRVASWRESRPGYLCDYRDRVPGLRAQLAAAERTRRRASRELAVDIRNVISPEGLEAKEDRRSFLGVDIRNAMSAEMLVLLGLLHALRRVDVRNQIDLGLAPCYKAGLRLWRALRRARCDRRSRNDRWFQAGSGQSREASAGSTGGSCGSAS